jgi:hypothetical protein
VPRTSPFAINLSGEERRDLESIARKYTSPYCDVIRAKIILLADERPIQRSHCGPPGYASTNCWQMASSVITSKPAIRYHFKTGQRDRTQDYMTLYRAARDSGKYFFD